MKINSTLGRLEVLTELAYILFDINITKRYQIRDTKLNLHLQQLLPPQIELRYFVQCCLLERRYFLQCCLLKLRNSVLGIGDGDEVIHSDEVVHGGWEGRKK
jgi:hypothetical protein